MRLFRRILAGCVVLAGASLPVVVQSQDVAAKAEFEVASIRPSTDKSMRGSEGGPGSKDATLYRYGQATLLDLIEVAWDVRTFQVSSSASLDRERFDLTARLPADATREQFRTMLQNFLAERFGLKTHIEQRDYPGYEMEVAKSGLKISEATEASPQPKPTEICANVVMPQAGHPAFDITVTFKDGYELNCSVVQLEPLSFLAGHLQLPGRPPVIDGTGLTGRYSFVLESIYGTPSAASDTPPPAPDVFTALPQQLGLRLVQKKLPFDTVVVDAFHPEPTEN